MPQTRVLILIRLSHLTDETTSPQRQLDVCNRYASDRDWVVVGVAEDLDVSASTTSPFDRPSLRPWLDRHHEYDVILFWRVDRLVRRVTHLARMIEWSDEHDVNLVSATEAHFDLSTSLGQIIALMVGMFAQMEADATSQRTSETYAHNIRLGKYRGGHPPFGYKPEKVGEEWRLVEDEVMAPLARDLAERIIGGARPSTLCAELNDAGHISPQDHFRVQQGKEPLGMKWRSGNLRRSISAPTILGQVVIRPATKKGGTKTYGPPEILRNEDGSPLVRSEPVLDRTTYDRLLKALDDMNGKRTPYKKSEALLLRVIYCGNCGRQMYYNKGRNKVYYRCSSASFETSCGNPAVENTYADQLVVETLLEEFGDTERSQRVYDPGEDHAVELADVEAELIDVAGLIGTGPFKSGPARAKLETRAEALEARRATLAEIPAREGGYRYEPTGETFSEHWSGMDNRAKNLFLRDNEVRLDWKADDWNLTFGDIERMQEAVRA